MHYRSPGLRSYRTECRVWIQTLEQKHHKMNNLKSAFRLSQTPDWSKITCHELHPVLFLCKSCLHFFRLNEFITKYYEKVF